MVSDESREVLEVIDSIETPEKAAPYDEVIARLQRQGWDEGDIDEAVRELIRADIIRETLYEPRLTRISEDNP